MLFKQRFVCLARYTFPADLQHDRKGERRDLSGSFYVRFGHECASMSASLLTLSSPVAAAAGGALQQQVIGLMRARRAARR